ncbi:MAG TPA: hypothetical protein VGK10_18180 [Prolixibacteraceae bacterium]
MAASLKIKQWAHFNESHRGKYPASKRSNGMKLDDLFPLLPDKL